MVTFDELRALAIAGGADVLAFFEFLDELEKDVKQTQYDAIAPCALPMGGLSGDDGRDSFEDVTFYAGGWHETELPF